MLVAVICIRKQQKGVWSISKKSTPITSYKISSQDLEKIRDIIKAEDLERFKEILHKIKINYKSTSSLKSVLENLSRLKYKSWGKELVEISHPSHQVAGSLLLEWNEYWKIDPEFIFELIHVFCHSENWNVRHKAVDLLEHVIHDEVQGARDFFRDLVTADDPMERRLALSTAKNIAQSAIYEDSLKKELLYELTPSLREEDPYVVTIRSEAFEEGFMKNCPDLTLKWIRDQIDRVENQLSKTTLLHIVGSRYVGDKIDEVLKVIEIFLEDEDPEVKKARSSTLHQLTNTHHDEVASFLERRLDVKQAVDHWAELEADGSLSSFSF